VTRFDLRVFLSVQALGISPVIFYRMSEDPDWEWMNVSETPYPVYTAFQGLMTDLGAIAQPPIDECLTCSVPTVSSYNGYFPLATATFVGARAGDSANSILYYTWQRSYGTQWTAVASPGAVPVSVSVPSGMTVTSVKDLVTESAVGFSFAGQSLVYQVTDNPIEVLLTPVSPAQTQQTINFPAIASRVYGSTPFTVTANSSLGPNFPVIITVQSGPATISSNQVTVTGTGTVVLRASQAGNTAYGAATATQSFQVTPAQLTVTANNATRVYGATNPAFSGTVTGTVRGDQFTETFNTTATASSDPGTYPIVPEVVGADLASYSVTIVNGTLTVTAAKPLTATTTTVRIVHLKSTQGASVRLIATVSSVASGTATGSVVFYSGTTPVGTHTLNSFGSASLTTTLPVGTDRVTAVYAGGGTFQGSTSAEVTITVGLADEVTTDELKVATIA
jgi:hypothetical protein